MLVTDTAINSVRNKFLNACHKNSEHYHHSDVENVKHNDWCVERFLRSCNTEDDALKRLNEAMRWRNTFGVQKLTDNYFPLEIHKREEWFSYGKDREGRHLVWMRAKNHRKSSGDDEKYASLIKQFTIHQYEKIDSQVTDQRWAIIVDTTGMRLANTDFDYFRFLIDALQYYPLSIKYVAVVNMPWIINPFAKLFTTFMSEELRHALKYISKEELCDYLDPDVIPVHLGGNNKSNMCQIPDSICDL